MGAQVTLGPSSERLSTMQNFPVVETVLSVQFESLLFIHAAHLGLLWNEYRHAFPVADERPPLDPFVEHFPESPGARLGLRLQTLDNLPIPRLWFANSQGTEMIQVQTDRFIKNWRKQEEAPQYPRYEVVRPNFERDYQIFLSFLNKNGLGRPCVNQCEVTYVNHIVAGEGWECYGDLERIFTFWHGPEQTPPGNAEDLLLHARFVIPDEAGNPIGRFHVHLQPAIRNSDSRPMYVLNLTARGQTGDGIAFLDIGHLWIKRTFRNLTTKPMHEIWGMDDA